MLDFVFGGGKREGAVVYAISGVGGVLGALFGGIPFGEIDGTRTERLKRLVAIFRQAGVGCASFHPHSRLSCHLHRHDDFDGGAGDHI